MITLPQEFYNENRDLYGAELSSQDIDSIQSKKCKHYMERKTSTTIECKNCHYGLIDMGRFILKDGLIDKVK